MGLAAVQRVNDQCEMEMCNVKSSVPAYRIEPASTVQPSDYRTLISFTVEIEELRNSHGDVGVGSSYLSYSNGDVVKAVL